MAGRRTLRSGKEFSAFDLAVGRAIPSPIHFDVGQHLKKQLLEQDSTGLVDEPQYNTEDATPFWLADPPPPDAVPPPPDVASLCPVHLCRPDQPLRTLVPRPPSYSFASWYVASQRNKLKFKARRARKREQVRHLSDNPLLKSIHRKHIDDGKASALNLDFDTGETVHLIYD
ncbi:hypothetical protein B0H14DRAFT_3437474 [Mycena olivaceomarginata]|nr:hypothetical protein B0H14DRAFT_3437474 [Mycena olivaceomarginata]